MSDRVLLVEDRASLRAMLARALAVEFDVEEAADLSFALGALQEERFAVVVTDVRLPSGSGVQVLAAARRLDPPPEVVMMTAYAEVPAAVAALKAGAYDYLAKPFQPEELLRSVRRAAERWRLVDRARRLEGALLDSESALVGSSPAMDKLRRQVDRLAPLPVAVLIRGESGTGKDVVARELHRLSGRARFVAVHCGSLPDSMLESALFGAGGGPAGPDRSGPLADALPGTLLLDEVGDLPPWLQTRLNGLLEDGELRTEGETSERRPDIRVIASTSQDLDAKVASGDFRLDLLYRLRASVVELPPLRDRRDDIAALCAAFLHRAAARFGTTASRLAPDALAALERAPWPGNLRELKHVIEQAAVMAGATVIEVSDLPDSLRELASPAEPGTYREVVEHARDQAGRRYLQGLLDRHAGNVTRSAAEAGVERESMHRLLRRHGVDPKRFREG